MRLIPRQEQVYFNESVLTYQILRVFVQSVGSREIERRRPYRVRKRRRRLNQVKDGSPRRFS